MLGRSLSRVRKVDVLNVIHFSTNKKTLLNVGINEKTGVATVAIQNLPVNVLSLELLEQMNKSIDDLVADKTRAIIFKSGIQNRFCSGIDLKEIYRPEKSRLTKYLGTMLDFYQKIYGCGLPTAVVINGHALAAGCVIAVACQYRVMVKGKYVIGFNEAELGLKFSTGVVNMIKEVISPREALLALTSAKIFTTDEALKVGLIDEISADPEDGIYKAEQFMRRFDKIHKSVGMDIRSTIRSEVQRQMQDCKNTDVQQVVAFVMKETTQANLSAYMHAIKN